MVVAVTSLSTQRSKLLFVGLLALVGCGQVDPPTNDQLNVELSKREAYFEVTRPDGTTMTCVQFGAESNGTQDSKSWFGFDCDWSGEYDKKPG